MPTFRATKIPAKTLSAENILSKFCYYFPQYTYEQARKLPYKTVRLMLKTAKIEQAKHMVDLLRVHSGSRTKKGQKSVLSYFEKIIEEK